MKLKAAFIVCTLAAGLTGCANGQKAEVETTVQVTETSAVETTAAEPAAEPAGDDVAGKKQPKQAEGEVKDYSKDLLLSTMVTPEAMGKGVMTDVDMVTKLAYSWGYPLVRMERVIREYTDVSQGVPPTSYRAPLNQIGWARELATPKALDMPTANNDTLYLSAVVDLKEPYVLSVPDTGSRYYVVNVFNMWHELEHYIGQRETGTKAGSFVIVPPGWDGDITSEAGTVLQASTSKVWLWGRLRVSDGDDMNELHVLQDKFDLRPVSELGNDGYVPEEAFLAPLPDVKDNPLAFMVHLGEALKDNPVPEDEKALFAQMSRAGLTEEGFDAGKLSEAAQAQMAESLQEAVSIPVGSMSSSGEVVNGWTCIYGLDNFGYNYPNRAVVSGPYLGGNGMEEAFYPVRYTDSTGETLSGDNVYKIAFGEEPPVESFWSLTAYDAETKLLIDNPMDRYKLGSDNELVKNDDGSFEITLCREEPENPANWLPVGDGDFYLILRMYIPDVEAIKSHQYEIPDVEQVK